MIEDNFNNELLEKETINNEGNIVNNEVVVIEKEKKNEQEDTTIESLENTTIFTPVVSDGIFEEEILELDDDIIDEPIIENNSVNNNISLDEEVDSNILKNNEVSEILDNTINVEKEQIKETNSTKLDFETSEQIVSNNENIIEKSNSELANNNYIDEQVSEFSDRADNTVSVEKEQINEPDFTKVDSETSEQIVSNNENIIEKSNSELDNNYYIDEQVNEISDVSDNAVNVEKEQINETNSTKLDSETNEQIVSDNENIIEKSNSELDNNYYIDEQVSEFSEGSDNTVSVEKEQIKETNSTKLDSETNEQIVSNNENIIEKNNDTLLEKYGENFSIKEYVCNPAIGRDNEIKQLILTLLTPEKSGILVGKPGIGKTAIVEGLGYQIQKGNVPDALKEYQIYKLNTSSLLGLMPGTNEPKIQVLLNEIKGQAKLILFIDEIHTLIGAGAEGDDSLDFANIFKPGLDRGNIKIIGATTSDEYDKYILTDKAFVRRFQKIDVLEPTKEHTVKIMMGSLPKLEHKTGAKLKYTSFIQEKIMTFIVDLTTEYRRVYELSARYPDVALTILQQAFSYAVFDNKKEVSIRDVRKAIANTKLVYSDVIKKELVRFNEVFSDIYLMETPQKLKGETSI